MTEPIKVLADIIQTEMGLQDGQVMLSYQKYNIPTEGLFILLTSVGPGQVISSTDAWEDDGAGGIEEVQTLTVIDTVQIDVMSFGDDARLRAKEVQMAIHSFYSEAKQEENSLQIARNVGPFRDTSALEPTQFLQRYTTEVRIISASTIRKAVDYYGDFTRAVPPGVTVDA